MQEKYVEAEPLARRALAIRERQLGGNHPDTANSLHNLASLYSEQGRDGEADPLFKRALVICTQTLGETHPNTQVVRRRYESLLGKLGREEEADSVEKRGHKESD